MVFERVKIPGKTVKEKTAYLFANPGFMEGQYLGSLLDSCRWGSQGTVMWERSARGMAELVEAWIGQNFERLPELFVRDYKPRELPGWPPYNGVKGFERVGINPRAREFFPWNVYTLEDVFDRLDLAHVGGSFVKPDTNFIVPMDGFSLASYARAWFEQDTQREKPLYKEA